MSISIYSVIIRDLNKIGDKLDSLLIQTGELREALAPKTETPETETIDKETPESETPETETQE